MNLLRRWLERFDRIAARRPGWALVILLGINGLFVAGFGIAARALPADGPSVVDLQLSLSNGVFTQIAVIWGDAIDSVFWSIVWFDFLFPVAYALLFRHAYVRASRSAALEPNTVIAVAPVGAAALDWLENLLLLFLLSMPMPPPALLVGLMSTAAILKFALLGLTAAFIVAAILKGDAVRVIRVARYAVLSLVIGTLPLLLLDQGRDLLVSLSHPSAAWHRLWFLLWLVVWAFSTWYWSRVLLDAEVARGTSPAFETWARWLPRWAGALTLIVPGVAILIETRHASRPWIMVALGAVALVLGVVFFWFVITRRQRDPDARAAVSFTLAMTALLHPGRELVFGSLALSLAMFTWLTLGAQSAGAALGAPAILTIAAANTVFFGSVVVFVTEARRIPVELCAFACAAVFSLWNDNHNVALVGFDPSRPSMATVFHDWMAAAPRAADGRVPVVIVAAEGGGIRAAYWTSAVLHRLDEDPSLQFARRVFAISSVSGSSFGAAVYAGLKRDAPGAPGSALASTILEQPFLAPMVAKLVSGDFLQWFLPAPIPPFDRSTAMELAFARAYQETVPNHPDTMSQPFASLRDEHARDVPLLFFNSVSVQSGRRVVTSMVEWLARATRPVDATDPIDLHDWLLADVPMAAAAHNSARFPYISPAGRLRAGNGEYLGHVVDGGYFDNTGAETVLDVIERLSHEPDAPAARFVVVTLANTMAKAQSVQKDQVAWRETRQFGELFSPFRALLQAREARGSLARDRLQTRVGDANLIDVRVCDDPADGRPAREAPLGWQLSAEMVAELQHQFTQQCFADAVARVAAALR
jgi:hypothetical protein